MMNCILIHGCAGNEADALDPQTGATWIAWTKDQLTARGVRVATPEMPQSWEPVYERFKEALEKETINEDTVLVGHSCGCAFLVRWLGETKQKIAKLILVAAWKTTKDDPIRQAFYVYPIDQTIPSRIKEIVMFTSNDEEANGKKSLQMFHEVLGGRVIELPEHGHYISESMPSPAFPELFSEILS